MSSVLPRQIKKNKQAACIPISKKGGGEDGTACRETIIIGCGKEILLSIPVELFSLFLFRQAVRKIIRNIKNNGPLFYFLLSFYPLPWIDATSYKEFPSFFVPTPPKGRRRYHPRFGNKNGKEIHARSLSNTVGCDRIPRTLFFHVVVWLFFFLTNSWLSILSYANNFFPLPLSKKKWERL